ncbi:hypothetical protein O3P69_005704 [Scylla paramamosain]|uniref:Uncharacterized protein n=1 Tax=Scylla paramamosain TaxID=85552 RepID=A0AAW0UAP6_SCYPA
MTLWRIYKRNPTRWNKDRHKDAAAHIEATQAWAREQWVENKKRKLRGGHIDSKRKRLSTTTNDAIGRKDAQLSYFSLLKALEVIVSEGESQLPPLPPSPQ